MTMNNSTNTNLESQDQDIPKKGIFTLKNVVIGSLCLVTALALILWAGKYIFIQKSTDQSSVKSEKIKANVNTENDLPHPPSNTDDVNSTNVDIMFFRESSDSTHEIFSFDLTQKLAKRTCDNCENLDEYAAESAKFSFDGAKVVFVKDDIINVRRCDGKSINLELQLPDHITEPIHPSFSPDGCSLVFSGTLTAEGLRQLFTINIDSKEVKQVIHLAESEKIDFEYLNEPVYTPDGKFIFCKTYGGKIKSWKVSIFEAESGNFDKHILPKPKHILHSFDISADGLKIVMLEQCAGEKVETNKPPKSKLKIFIVNVNDGQHLGDKSIYETESGINSVSWSPDGNFIIFDENETNYDENESESNILAKIKVPSDAGSDDANDGTHVEYLLDKDGKHIRGSRPVWIKRGDKI